MEGPPKSYEETSRKKSARALACSLAWTAVASAQQYAIDAGKSVMTVHVFKAGLFSACEDFQCQLDYAIVSLCLSELAE